MTSGSRGKNFPGEHEGGPDVLYVRFPVSQAEEDAPPVHQYGCIGPAAERCLFRLLVRKGSTGEGGQGLIPGTCKTNDDMDRIRPFQEAGKALFKVRRGAFIHLEPHLRQGLYFFAGQGDGCAEIIGRGISFVAGLITMLALTQWV